MIIMQISYVLSINKLGIKKSHSSLSYKGTRSFSRGTTQINVIHYVHFVSLTQIYGKDYSLHPCNLKGEFIFFLGTVFTTHCLSTPR